MNVRDKFEPMTIIADVSRSLLRQLERAAQKPTEAELDFGVRNTFDRYLAANYPLADIEKRDRQHTLHIRRIKP